MPQATKIATCCYCGTRAALVLSGSVRHELACSACGAPLHHLKMLRSDAVGQRRAPPRAMPKRDRQKKLAAPSTQAARRKPKKRRGRLMRKLFEEAFDVIEDIFD